MRASTCLSQNRQNLELFDFMTGRQRHDFTSEDPLNADAVKLMGKIHANGIELNRKVLADLAMNHPEAFKSIVDKVK